MIILSKMDRLKKGDYVTHLNEVQFNELMQISNNKFLSWYTSSLEGYGTFIPKSLMYYRECLVHSEISLLGNSFAFEEFKQRAINTFENGTKN